MSIISSLTRQSHVVTVSMTAAALLFSLEANAAVSAPAAGVVRIPFAPAEAIRLAERVADRQLQLYADGPSKSGLAGESYRETGWIQGALFVGLRELADRSANPKYKEAILARGRLNEWKTGPRPYHADDHVIGQAYLWAANHGGGKEALVPLQRRFDQILAAPPTGVGLQHGERGDPAVPDCKKRWCWADALFMAPPAWVELSNVTGDPKYANYAKAEFLAVSAYLFDQNEHLYFRDSRFFDRRGPNGEKIFWSRGSGWVHAGLARVIPLLPANDPARAQMEIIFKQMSARLVKLQKQDGYWSPSLLADPASTRPETSGTGFFTYGLAWGIKAGLLDRAHYEPAVRRGWAALTRAVHADGLLGYVQPVGDRPDNVSFNHTQFYGGGAFLLAATAIADLKLAPGKDLTVDSLVAYPQMVLAVRTEEKNYQLKSRYTVPADHRIGDGSIAFEGVGWESDLVAYRLYLDERMAIDIFGKKIPGQMLHTIGQGGDSYHRMAPWGMDIFKVGDSVGIGGIGRLRDDKAVQLGRSSISVSLDNTHAREASAEIKNAGLDEGNSNLVTRIAIRAGSALTRVSAQAAPAASVPLAMDPFVTGLVVHPGTTIIEEGPDASGWAYIATWGAQSVAKENLGLVVFYRPDSVAGAPRNDGATLFIVFKDPAKIDYAFGSAWAQDQQGIKSLPEFRSWLGKRRGELAVTQEKPVL